jgi:uncharacterized protein (DUF1015 family)
MNLDTEMPQISPFLGLRFDENRVGDLGAVLCPPYDVISPAEQQQLLDQSPFNIVRVELSREESSDDNSRNQYVRAAELIGQWRAAGALTDEQRPAYYLMAHTFSWAGQNYTRHGLFSAVRLHPWSDGVVLPHEETFSGPKEDRYKLLKATNVNVSPVFMVLREQPEALKQAWTAAEAKSAAVDVTLNGERHQLWVLDDPETVENIAEELEGRTLYIADGHHRYETALRYSVERSEAQRLDEDHPAHFVLSYIATMDDPGLVVLPTHRLIRGVSSENVRDVIRGYGSAFVSESVPLDSAAGGLKRTQQRIDELARERPTFGLIGFDARDVTIYSLSDSSVMEQLLPNAVSAWRALDVSVLQTLVLNPLLPTHQERDSSLTYTRDPELALASVRNGDAQAAFIMSTPSVPAMANVADARARMPEKSTYFYPKVPTGIVMRSIA